MGTSLFLKFFATALLDACGIAGGSGNLSGSNPADIGLYSPAAPTRGVASGSLVNRARPRAGFLYLNRMQQQTKLWQQRLEQISTAAYYRAVHRNFELGHESQDWLAAESQIDATWSPAPEAWIEGVEEVFLSLFTLPSLSYASDNYAHCALTGVLDGLPQETLVRLALTALRISNLHEARALFEEIVPRLTIESLRGLLPNAASSAHSLVELLRHCPELWPEALQVIHPASQGAFYDLDVVAAALPTELIASFWQSLRTRDRARVLGSLLPRLPDNLLPEARSILDAETIDRSRLDLLRHLATRLPHFWAETIESAAALPEAWDRDRWFGRILVDIPENFLPQLVAAVHREPEILQQAAHLAHIAERYPTAWPDALSARRNATSGKGLPLIPDHIWSALPISAQALSLAALLYDQDADALLTAIAPSHTELWPAVLERISHTTNPEWYLEKIAAKIPDSAVPTALRYLASCWNYSTGEAKLTRQLMARVSDPELFALIDHLRDSRHEPVLAIALTRLAPTNSDAYFQALSLAAVLVQNYSPARAQILEELLENPSPDRLPRSLEIARTLQDLTDRAQLLGLLAPHLPETWPEAIDAVETVPNPVLRFRFLYKALDHLPEPLLPRALSIAQSLTEPSHRAQLLGKIAESAPPELFRTLLAETHSLPEHAKASALTKLAFHAPLDLLPEIVRVAPWFHYGHNAELNRVLDRIKAYWPILPPRLIRNAIIVLMHELYRAWVQINVKPQGIFGGNVTDPNAPARSFWPFLTKQWSLTLECAAFTHANLHKGEWFVLSLWAYQAAARDAVRQLARESSRAQLAGRTTALSAKKGARITFFFHPKHLLLDPDQSPSPTLTFTGDPANLDLAVQCPTDYVQDHLVERIDLLVEGLKIAELLIEFRFAPNTDSPTTSHFRQIRSAFASYSTRDIAQVIARLQAVEKANPGIRLFWDKESLKSGDKWQDRLAREVADKDVFYLFWSENAAESKWVDWEWRHAHQTRGLDYIHPFPLDNTAPPDELKPLQFGDRWTRYLEYEELKKISR